VAGRDRQKGRDLTLSSVMGYESGVFESQKGNPGLIASRNGTRRRMQTILWSGVRGCGRTVSMKD
jgi:hypothetical protein